MGDQPGHRRLDVEHRQFGLAAGRVDADPAPVGLLAATLGVERRGVEDDLHLLALVGRVEQAVLADDRDDARLAEHLAVAGELHAARLQRRAVHRQVAVRGLLGLGVGLRAGALLGH